jgi:very-short-patch-repair endonuclease
MPLCTDRTHLERARRLRHEMTPAEIAIWHHVRGNKLGFHFRRQPPILGFYPDFSCLDLRLVVEVDGGIHESRVDYDKERTAVLEGQGFTVIRFRNEEVSSDPRACCERIRTVCLARTEQRAMQRPHRRVRSANLPAPETIRHWLDLYQ